MAEIFHLYPTGVFSNFSISISVINVKFESDSYAVSEGEEAEVCVVFETERLKKDVHLSVISRSDTAIIGQDYNMPSMLPLTLNPMQHQPHLLCCGYRRGHPGGGRGDFSADFNRQ